MHLVHSKLQKNSYEINFLVALAATLGSLYFSEIAGFPPCALCWWQRIAIYPLVVIFLVGIFRKDNNAPYYALPLIILGWLTSFYHNLLYYGIISDEVPCALGISCTTKYVEYFGFITIPLLALCALTLMGLLSLYAIKHKRFGIFS